MATRRLYDLVLFGATGFTGRLTAEYLARHAPPETRWALAGRNPGRLESVRKGLGEINPACANLAVLQADVNDAASLQAIAEAGRVVMTTVGPYIVHGEPLVAACAAAGTDYVDLTGEPEFVDLMWLRYHEQAQRSGARLVHCCGFDSVPHDLGVYHIVQQMPEGVPLTVEGFVRAGGGFSAGTYHSVIHAFARYREASRTRRERRQREAPPPGRVIESTTMRTRKEPDLGSWVIPLPTIDPQVVRRSAAALDRYGPQFRYGHYLQMKNLAQLVALLGGVGGMFGLAQLKATRNWLLSRKSSGEGPSAAQRAKGWFRVRFVARGGGRRVVSEVTGGDPGYGETAKMLAESALCLAFDPLPARSGQLTPAVAMGDALLERLQRAGIRFNVLERI